MVTSTVSLRQIAEESGSDPRGAVLRVVGDFSGLDIAAQRVLVAIYVRPEKTKGGIYRPDENLAEDRFQAKVGLVLKVGSLAFVDDTVNKFGGFRVDPGEWAIFNPSDGLEMFKIADNGRDGTPIRWFADTSIVGKTDDPGRIY
jgi:co-chaperonin GroES (HSP10)